MRRMALAATAAVVCASGASLYAHHSYPEFLVEQEATVDGTIERVDFRNPHVQITLRTADSTLYTVIWQGALYLHAHIQFVSPVQAPVESDTLRPGDRIIVTGAPPRDSARHELVRLTAVQRPRDGWLWTCHRPEQRIRCG
jgi:hypothetical protein